jgi:hypothetical protein
MIPIEITTSIDKRGLIISLKNIKIPPEINNDFIVYSEGSIPK